MNHLSDKAKEGYSLPETLTCHMSCPVNYGSVTRGEDYFQVAERMDIVGITHYIPAKGPMYYFGCQVLDAAESAAAVFGKHAWLIEYNGRTDLSANEWERETYSAIGSGYKGIMYYQWRADYPYEDGPEPEGFGMVFNDRTKTKKYDRAVSMNRLINRVGSFFTYAEKKRSGIAILYSEYVNAWYDAIDNGSANASNECHERSIDYMKMIYREFRKEGVTVDFVRARDLENNPLAVKLLIIPSKNGLTHQELTYIDRFKLDGGMVALYDSTHFGFKIIQQDTTAELIDARALLRMTEINPCYECAVKELDIKVLEGDYHGNHFYVACLINIDSLEEPIPAGANVCLNLSDINKECFIRFVTPQAESQIKACNKDGKLYIVLPEIETGAFLFISNNELYL